MNKLLLILFFAVSPLAVGKAAAEDLARQFQTPPRQAQPWVFWVWLNANTTHAAITRDLEEMKAKGIVGCILYDCGAGKVGPIKRKLILVNKKYRGVPTDEFKDAYTTPVPTGPLATWSPGWDELVGFAAKEANRLGLDFVVTDGLGNTSGPIPEEYSLQKLVWTETPVHGLQVYDGILPEPVIDAPKGVFPHPGPAFYHRDVAVLAVPDQAGFSPDKVIDLTSKMDATGHLRWSAPEGSWKIIRFLQVSTGAHNIWGYYADSMSTEALDKLWAVTIMPLLKAMIPEERRGLKGIEDDSWESGKTMWTKLFPEEFKQRRGYDLIPWLPLLAGIKMDDATNQVRVLRDYALTISDLIADNHYAHLKKLANDNGLTCYSEAAGPNYDQTDVLKTSSRVDVAMAEFWMPSENCPTDMQALLCVRNAATANHIYGKPVTMCEAFTSMGPEWEQTPFTMKPVADQVFCDGLNRICFHNFAQSPSLTAKPGYVYYAGTHYEPGITWWDQTPAFNAYLARCSYLLQQGKFVADAIFYRGDNIGKGEGIKTIPPTLGEGYDHDNCNSEVILTRMSVRKGSIVMPDGMSYRVLVLPDNLPMTLEVLDKVAALIKAGATVVGPPPAGMAGMPRYLGEEDKFNAAAAQLWGGLDGTNVTQKNVGAGQLIWGQTARQVLQKEATPPDFEASGISDAGTIDWIHRKVGDVEIYYVTSHWAHPEKIVCTFRVSGKQPELWDAVTGKIRDATAFHQEDGRTVVPLEFDPCGSIFVVFRKPIPATLSGKTASNYPTTQLLTTLTRAWTVHFDPKWGGPESVVFDTLTDWTNRPEAGIKFYSGTAVYHTKFDLPTPSTSAPRLLLDLGEVHEIASVRLNGHNLGVLWTKPARVDITGLAKAKDNDLEVTVVNLWPNRLIGDEFLPKESRFTETNMHKFGTASPPLRSGLIGPVKLLTAEAPLMKPN